MTQNKMFIFPRGKVLRGFIFLSLLWSFFFAIGTASALGVELLSSETEPACIVLQLDSATPSYYVRFNYHSNVASVQQRSSLVVTQRLVNDINSGRAYYAKADRREVFTPEAIMEKQQKMGSVDEKYLFSVSVEADYFTGEQGVIDGSYECCFSLERPSHWSFREETVDILFVEVVPHEMQVTSGGATAPRRGTHFKHEDTRHTSLHSADDMGWINEIALEADKVRRGVQEDYKTVKTEDTLSAQAIRHKLDLVAETHDMLLFVLNDVVHLRGRNARMQRTTESTFTRIWISALIIITVLVSVAYGTFAFTKNLLIKRKLV